MGYHLKGTIRSMLYFEEEQTIRCQKVKVKIDNQYSTKC